LTGSSGQVILPGIGSVVAALRAMPHWYQIRARSNGQKMMQNWKGRQVIDVDKHYDSKKESTESE